MTTLILLAIGLIAGLLSGVFGIGGGVLIVPALVYGLGFDQKLATGTSLAILLPPVGLAAVLEYHRRGDVDLRAAVLIAVMLLVGSWLGANLAGRLDTRMIKAAFGVFLVVLGAWISFEALSSR